MLKRMKIHNPKFYLNFLMGGACLLALALAIGGRRMVKLYEYPEESIMIG